MFFKTFSFRIMFIAFVGTHIPLLTVIFFFIFGPGRAYTPFEVISFTLAATLTAAVGTLLFVNKQIQPVRKAALSLVGLRAGLETPTMPVTDCLELRQLFSAIDEGYARAQTLTRQQESVMQKLKLQVKEADNSRLHTLDKLVNNPGLELHERRVIYQDLHLSVNNQIDSIRSVIGQMGGGMHAN